MKFVIHLFVLFFVSQTWANTANDSFCSAQENLLMNEITKIYPTSKNIKMAMDQVDKDMQNKDLLCARDHINELLMYLGQFIDLSNEALEISAEGASKCSEKGFQETSNEIKQAVYDIAFVVSDWQTTLSLVTAAAEQKGITAEQKCSISLQK